MTAVRVARAALLVAVLGAGCGPGAAPPAPLAPAPDRHGPVTEPPHRAIRVDLATGIHAVFDTELDPATLIPTNLFFKVDDRRYPVRLDWIESARRLTVTPLEPLLPGRTYTVEFTSRVRRRDGTALFPGGWLWQFTTLSIRPLRTPDPPDAERWVSPFMRLRWDPTEAAAGQVVYQVFFGSDSIAVRERRSASAAVSEPRWIPKRRWGPGPVHWAVRVTNLRTGDVLEGPSWTFHPVPPGTPAEPRVLAALGFGTATSTAPPRCGTPAWVVSPAGISAIRWERPPAGVRLDHAEFHATLFPLVSAAMTLRATAADWSDCGIRYPGTPVAIGPPLASSRRIASGHLFQSDTLTAFLEAAARDGDLFGFVLEASREVSIVTNNPADPMLGGLLIRTFPDPPPAAR